ncbi:unnamed protein product [Xylocopa violacea]|uniref:RNase H type-1 domain-containing protein n=1 Tax=Xylocopa violacea TaxID=135666 RepID=A0ABP1N969_XYLVO
MEMSEGNMMENYTDGSKYKTVNANGIGIITRNNLRWEEKSVAISNRAAIFTTEAIAISEAWSIAEKYIMEDRKGKKQQHKAGYSMDTSIWKKEGTTLPPEKNYKKSATDINTDNKEKIWEMMEMKMKEQSQWKGKCYFEAEYNQGKRKPWFDHLKGLSRNAITTLSRVRSDHYNLEYSMWRKRLTASPTCECGIEDEDINHIV